MVNVQEVNSNGVAGFRAVNSGLRLTKFSGNSVILPSWFSLDSQTVIE